MKKLHKMKQTFKKLGPCPSDFEKEFKLNKKGGQVVTCQSFQENVGRCNKIHEGELKCNSICGRHVEEVCAKTSIKKKTAE